MTVYVSGPRQVEASRIESGDWRVSDPAFGDFVVSSPHFEKFFRRPASDERAEKAAAEIVAAAQIDDDLRVELLNSFCSTNPFAFAQYLRSVDLPETVARELLKEKISTTR